MASSICTELINKSFCWLANTNVYVCKSPYKNVTYEFIHASPLYFAYLIFKIGDKWLYSYCLVGCCFQDLFKTVCSILMYFPSSFSLIILRFQVVKLYSSTDGYSLEEFKFYFIRKIMKWYFEWFTLSSIEASIDCC